MMKVCLLGASGSIGQQTLEVMLDNPNDFDLVAFSIGRRVRKISNILKTFPNVRAICLQDKEDAKRYQNKYTDVIFFWGDDGLNQLIKFSKADIVVNALVGFVGLKPSITTLENNKILCLANKESLVVGGELINKLLKKGLGKIYPIDSEHAAIRKCLSVDDQNVEKIIITASGGPFRNLKREDLKIVTPEQALNHPNWNMGQKITIDSATMVNKAFEIIEAHSLFGFEGSKIDTIINFNSYVHSIVQYTDGTYRLDAGKPDMRIPIKYALYQGLTDYQTIVTDDLSKIKKTAFGKLLITRYPIIKVAYQVIDEKGTLGAIFNASNEVAVRAFLDKKISFLGIEKIINYCLKKIENKKHPSYADLKRVDEETRALANKLVMKGGY